MNTNNPLSLGTIRDLFVANNLESVATVMPIQAGFTNDLYVINDNYVLKVCGKAFNEPSFGKEAYFYQFFSGQIPVPNLLVFDTSKRRIGSFYMIYEHIKGETLFARWSDYSVDEKEQIISQLAAILKVINEADVTDYAARFSEAPALNWQSERLTQLKMVLNIVRQQSLLSAKLVTKIEQYIEQNAAALKQQKLGITYWDLHFDNVLVAGSTVVGLIDFEGVGMMSVDYALDTIRRLSQYPEIYAPEGIDDEVRQHKADYRSIYALFKKYYPALFDFENLEQRLNLYSIEYDLKLLPQFPNSQTLKARLQTYLPDDDNV